jgi:hypothetical protein
MLSNARETLIQLAEKISDLRQEITETQEQLQRAEAEFDRAVESVGSQASVPRRTPGALRTAAPTPEQGEKSLNQLIVDVIDSNCKKTEDDLDADEIHGILPEGTNMDTVRSALARLNDLGKIRRTTRGRYGSVLHRDSGPERMAS